jgi:hypothetical protein
VRRPADQHFGGVIVHGDDLVHGHPVGLIQLVPKEPFHVASLPKSLV